MDDHHLEIAAVVDSAKLQYEVEADHFVYLHEVLTEVRRIAPDIKLPEFEVFYVKHECPISGLEPPRFHLALSTHNFGSRRRPTLAY